MLKNNIELNNMNIIIDGNIGCGKSTILENLKKSIEVLNQNSDKSFDIKDENLTDWKPYLLQFYKDMNKYSLSFQMKVLKHHMLNNLNKTADISILERSPLSCLHVFGQNLYETNMISELDMQLMVDYNTYFGWYPKHIIYIKTDPEICKSRINKRNRDGEDSIPIEYLSSIDSLYNKLYTDNEYLQKIKGLTDVKVYVIDGNRDKESVYKDVIEIILSFI